MSYVKVIIKPDFVLPWEKKRITWEIKTKIKLINQDNKIIKITKVTNKWVFKVINKVGVEIPEIQTDKILTKATINLHNLKVEVPRWKKLSLNL